VIAVLKNDTTYGDITDLNQLPHRLLDAIKHYFLTYKNFPQDKHQKVSIDEMYDSASAYDVIRAGEEDYEKVPG
jgi:inorganic pyrophosphatase